MDLGFTPKPKSLLNVLDHLIQRVSTSSVNYYYTYCNGKSSVMMLGVHLFIFHTRFRFGIS